MSRSNFADILSNINDFKKIIAEIQNLSPQVKSALSIIFNELNRDDTSQQRKQDIYDAIQFAVHKMQNDPAVILGCDRDDPEELKKKIYHLKSQYFHPDGKSPDAKKFRRIKQAFDRIKK